MPRGKQHQKTEVSTKKKFVNTELAAKALGLSPGTLHNHRYNGTGLPYVKFGSRILYDVADILKYLEDHKVYPANSS